MRSKKTVYNIISTLILQFIVTIYGFIIPKVIVTSFGSDVNGLISSVTQFLGYITLLEAGIGPVTKAALYKPVAKKNKQEIANILRASENFFKSISYIFIVYVLILAFVYPLIVSTNFSYVYTFSLIIIIAISTFSEYYFGMNYRLYLQAEQKTYIISLIQIIIYVLNILIILIFVKLDFSIHIIKLVSCLVFIMRPLIQNVYVKKHFKIDLKLADEKYSLKNKWDGFAQHIASVIHNNTDVTVLTFFCSLTDVSIYSIYHMVTIGIKSIVQSFIGGIDASFGDMIAKDEDENLKRKFNMFEIFYHSVITILYTCTLLLLISFIKIYSLGINDANYIRPLFGYLLVISEFVWAIRLPYSSITLVAGHFKETKRGAWIEAITNIVISVICVVKYGLVGVAIGTIISMFIRTVEFMYHTNKYILKRSILDSLKKIVIIIIEVILITGLVKYIPRIEIVSYFTWIIDAIIVFIITSFIVLFINMIVFKNDFKELFKILRNVFRKKVKN